MALRLADILAVVATCAKKLTIATTSERFDEFAVNWQSVRDSAKVREGSLSAGWPVAGEREHIRTGAVEAMDSPCCLQVWVC